MSLENQNMFDAYLNNELVVNEKRAFEERLMEDKNFVREFEEYKLLVAQIKDAEISEFRKKIGSWEGQKNNGKAIRIKVISLIGAAAAAAILLFTVLNWKDANENLVSANFRAYEDILTVRSNMDKCGDAMKMYNEENYENAIVGFESCANSETVNFYKAESYMALGQYNEAHQLYKSLLGDPLLDEIAVWHYSLSLIGMDKVEEALKELELIPKNSAYYDDARALILKIK